MITGGCILTAITTGALTAWGLALLGRPIAALAILYLASTLAAYVLNYRRHPSRTRIFRPLMRAAWALTAALTLLTLTSWAMHRDPIPPAIWTSVVATYATATALLWHRLTAR